MMQPNILLILVDDLNAWIGALGRHPQVRTPNIDTLARRGALFLHAYCSAPYCNASRMGLFTGCLPQTLGVYANEPFWSRPDRPPTFIELLRESGYFTIGAGKVFHGVFDYKKAGAERLASAPWREIENRDALWDQFHPIIDEPLPSARPMNRLFDFSDFAAVPAMYHHFDWGPLPDSREAETPDARTVRELSTFLKAPTRQPFLCVAGLYKPHLPWHAPSRFFDLYAGNIAVPLVRDDDLEDVPETARRWALSPPDHDLVTSRSAWKDAVRGYLACISYADYLVGALVSALQASPAFDNTAIVLCGDNGFHLGEKLHWRKFALWEEATRVPLVYVPPGAKPQAARILEPVSLIDIFPSVLELAGLPLRPVDGESFLHLNAEKSRSRPVISTWGKGNNSMRTRRWRYTSYADGGHELYDHASDPYEWTNLAEMPEFAAVCANLELTLQGR